jgi:hypothetical protein
MASLDTERKSNISLQLTVDRMQEDIRMLKLELREKEKKVARLADQVVNGGAAEYFRRNLDKYLPE